MKDPLANNFLVPILGRSFTTPFPWYVSPDTVFEPKSDSQALVALKALSYKRISITSEYGTVSAVLLSKRLTIEFGTI